MVNNIKESPDKKNIKLLSDYSVSNEVSSTTSSQSIINSLKNDLTKSNNNFSNSCNEIISDFINTISKILPSKLNKLNENNQKENEKEKKIENKNEIKTMDVDIDVDIDKNTDTNMNNMKDEKINMNSNCSLKEKYQSSSSLSSSVSNNCNKKNKFNQQEMNNDFNQDNKNCLDNEHKTNIENNDSSNTIKDKDFSSVIDIKSSCEKIVKNKSNIINNSEEKHSNQVLMSTSSNIKDELEITPNYSNNSKNNYNVDDDDDDDVLEILTIKRSSESNLSDPKSMNINENDSIKNVKVNNGIHKNEEIVHSFSSARKSNDFKIIHMKKEKKSNHPDTDDDSKADIKFSKDVDMKINSTIVNRQKEEEEKKLEEEKEKERKIIETEIKDLSKDLDIDLIALEKKYEELIKLKNDAKLEDQYLESTKKSQKLKSNQTYLSEQEIQENESTEDFIEKMKKKLETIRNQSIIMNTKEKRMDNSSKKENNKNVYKVNEGESKHFRETSLSNSKDVSIIEDDVSVASNKILTIDIDSNTDKNEKNDEEKSKNDRMLERKKNLMPEKNSYNNTNNDNDMNDSLIELIESSSNDFYESIVTQNKECKKASSTLEKLNTVNVLDDLVKNTSSSSYALEKVENKEKDNNKKNSITENDTQNKDYLKYKQRSKINEEKDKRHLLSDDDSNEISSSDSNQAILPSSDDDLEEDTLIYYNPSAQPLEESENSVVSVKSFLLPTSSTSSSTNNDIKKNIKVNKESFLVNNSNSNLITKLKNNTINLPSINQDRQIESPEELIINDDEENETEKDDKSNSNDVIEIDDEKKVKRKKPIIIIPNRIKKNNGNVKDDDNDSNNNVITRNDNNEAITNSIEDEKKNKKNIEVITIVDNSNSNQLDEDEKKVNDVETSDSSKENEITERESIIMIIKDVIKGFKNRNNKKNSHDQVRSNSLYPLQHNSYSRCQEKEYIDSENKETSIQKEEEMNVDMEEEENDMENRIEDEVVFDSEPDSEDNTDIITTSTRLPIPTIEIETEMNKVSKKKKMNDNMDQSNMNNRAKKIRYISIDSCNSDDNFLNINSMKEPNKVEEEVKEKEEEEEEKERKNDEDNENEDIKEIKKDIDEEDRVFEISGESDKTETSAIYSGTMNNNEIKNEDKAYYLEKEENLINEEEIKNKMMKTSNSLNDINIDEASIDIHKRHKKSSSYDEIIKNKKSILPRPSNTLEKNEKKELIRNMDMDKDEKANKNNDYDDKIEDKSNDKNENIDQIVDENKNKTEVNKGNEDTTQDQNEYSNHSNLNEDEDLINDK